MKLILFFILFLFQSVAFADAASDLEQGKQLLAQGKKKEAWQVLHPLAHQERNPEALLLMGQVLVDSNEIDNNLAKAIPYFKAAEAEGNPIAGSLRQATEKMLEYETRNQRNIQKLQALHEQNLKDWKALQKRIGNGFIGPDGDIYESKIEVFSDGNSGLPKEVSDYIAANPGQFSSVYVEYYLVIPEAKLGATDIFPKGYAPPSGGFTPDLDAKRADTLGINTLPSIVLFPRKGESHLVSIQELRKWAKQRRDAR